MRGLRRKLARSWLDLEYETLIPLFSRLPQRVAFLLFTMRALVQYMFDYDWKTYTCCQKFHRQQTSYALRRIRPAADEQTIRSLVLRRFIHESHDEYLSCLLTRPQGATILDRVVIENLDCLRSVNRSSGIIFVSLHYDAFCLGLAALGRQGLNMYVVNTEAITSDAIPAGVRSYYRRKYAAMESLMNGTMPYVEVSQAPFIDALRRRDCVGLMGDIPGNRSTVTIDFLGASFRMPLGAWKFARETQSKLSAFVCVREAGHRYRVATLRPYAAVDDPLASMRPIYEFLEKQVRQRPERWTSSYLLEGYESGTSE